MNTEHFTERPTEYCTSDLCSIFGVNDLDLYFEPGGRLIAPRAYVKLTFEDRESANWFKNHVLKANSTKFSNFSLQDNKLYFDLTIELVREYYDVATSNVFFIDGRLVQRPHPVTQIDWALIHKYGGEETLIKILWHFADETILDAEVIEEEVLAPGEDVSEEVEVILKSDQE